MVGRSGREAALEHIPELRVALKVDFLVVNGENAAGGFGITDKIAKEFFEAGTDYITTATMSGTRRNWSVRSTASRASCAR